MDPLSFTPGLTLVNAFNDETFVFTTPESTEAAEFEVRLGPGGSGGGNAMVHIHPKTDETFTVRSGRLTVSIDGQMHELRPSEMITVLAGKPHFFRNAHDGNTVVIIRFTPAQHQLRFFLNFATIAQNRPEWFGSKGEPSFLLMALTLHTFKDHFYVAGPPVWAQKMLFATLAPIARLIGYKVVISP
ncbi:cupin domain-containing protein [Microvirga yunnanensis]|uniref:cupin domain-containing protein n=1 Tax=Microvirga yunnanensis TaxID=2953740 RepID=UPI0021CA3E23|nr:cupin domain-containing protein [Microvirga sp. HBU65207]